MGMHDGVAYTIEHGAMPMQLDGHERQRYAYDKAWRDSIAVGWAFAMALRIQVSMARWR